MAEYGGKQRKQLSKVIGNSESKDVQLKRFIDNRPQAASQMNLIRSIQKKPNNTGLPDNLKSGVENLSGYSMDDVKVHYNSDKPTQLQALAYAQGMDIHVAPRQEKYLSHEAWRVIQQKQRRVQPTMQLQRVNINDNEGLEKEADVREEKAVQRKKPVEQFVDNRNSISKCQTIIKTIQYFKVPIQCFTEEDVRHRAYIISQRPERNGRTNEENWHHAEKELIAEEIYVNRQAEKNGDGREQNWDNAVVIHDFRGKEYEKKDYKLGYGHFDAKYVPYSKNLDITLPVFFQDSFDKNEDIFIDNVKNTWSKKFSIKCNPGGGHNGQPNFTNYTKKVWNTTLSPVNVNVKAEKEGDPTKAYFQIKRSAGQSKVTSGGTVNLRNGALGLDLVPSKNDDLAERNTVGHETGHMFGLADEYQIGNGKYIVPDAGIQAFDGTNIQTYNTNGTPFTHKGKKYQIKAGSPRTLEIENSPGVWERTNALPGTITRHHDLTKEAFGDDYANNNAVMDNTKKAGTIMGSGTQVQKHHYVTFWDAMVQAIKAQYSGDPSLVAPNVHDDWQIV